MDSLGQYVFTSLLKVLTAFTGDYFRTISESFRDIFQILVVLYIMGVGYAVLMNSLGERTKSAVSSIFVILICYALVFDTNVFSEWVYMPLRKASLGLTSLVLSPSAATWRSRMPVRLRIHSSDVSTIFSRSRLVSTFFGT